MTRDELIARQQAKVRPVPFPDEAEPEFYLRPFKASERREGFEWQKVHGAENFYQFLYVRAVCDADGNRFFTDDDAPLVATFLMSEVEEVAVRVVRMNRLGQDEGKVPSPTTPS